MFWYGMTMRGHAWRGANYSLRSTSIRPNVRGYAVAPNWGPPAGLLHRTGAAQFIPSATEIGDQVKMLVEFRPGILLVYPGVLDAICQHRRAHSIALPDLRHIDTLGETLSPRIREQAMAQFGASVRDLYSSNEVGAIAYQCPSTDTYQLMAESVIVEVADDGGRICAPGEAGRVLVTDLHSFATPLIRYEIGDHAEVGEPCSCGRGLPTLRRILGRERNLMRLPGGGRRWPQVGFARFRDVASVQQYQFIQHRIDDIELRLVVERPLTAREEDDLRSVALRSLGVVAALRLVYFDGRLPTGSSGKFEEFVCLIG
jgi:phenylacetate-CoA ligase